MSLMSKVQALIAGITSPRVRLDVAGTINFLYELYASGRINEEQLRSDLFEICFEVIAMSNPDLMDEEIRERTGIVVDDLVRTMKIEGVRRRMIARFTSRY